jgi:hypothetical protein
MKQSSSLTASEMVKGWSAATTLLSAERSRDGGRGSGAGIVFVDAALLLERSCRSGVLGTPGRCSHAKGTVEAAACSGERRKRWWNGEGDREKENKGEAGEDAGDGEARDAAENGERRRCCLRRRRRVAEGAGGEERA